GDPGLLADDKAPFRTADDQHHVAGAFRRAKEKDLLARKIGIDRDRVLGGFREHDVLSNRTGSGSAGDWRGSDTQQEEDAKRSAAILRLHFAFSRALSHPVRPSGRKSDAPECLRDNGIERSAACTFEVPYRPIDRVKRGAQP